MTWEDQDAALATAMMATAKLERLRAAQRDGHFPGGAPQHKRVGKSPNKPTPAGVAALKLLEADPDMSIAEISRRTGLSESGVRNIRRKSFGLRPQGCRPGQGGAKRTQASIAAERLLRDGATVRHASEATGLSLRRVKSLAKLIRDERNAA